MQTSINIEYLAVTCRDHALSVARPNQAPPSTFNFCEQCPLSSQILRRSEGWRMRLDLHSGVVQCARSDIPAIFMPPQCYTCAWVKEPS
jgi:hypothetical protein